MKRFKCSGERIPALQLALGKRACLRTAPGETLRLPSEVASFVNRHYGCSSQEHFLSILMNTRNEVLGVQEVALGGLAAAPVDPKVLFGGAVAAGASSLILVHNHPSGDATPSQADVALTRQIVIGAGYLTIQVLDHVVVGRGGTFHSMRSQSDSASIFARESST